MPIKITDEPEVSCTKKELEHYTAEWNHRFMMFAGERPSLAAFIKREQDRERNGLKNRIGKITNG